MLDRTGYRFVAVLNKKIETGRLMNALGHMAAGFTAMYPDTNKLQFDTYIDRDNSEHGKLSDNPFIVLAADNSSQIYTLRTVLIENKIVFNDFTNTMTTGTFVEQREKTRQTSSADLEYYGICFFGGDEQLKPITKKFSLWR